jgi:adenylate kinase
MTDRPADLIIFGPPGSGKSTQAAQLAEQLGLVHLNPGMIFRQMAAKESAIGRQIRDVIAEGRLVPDELTDKLVREQLKTIAPEKGIVLEGYPRQAAQARTLRRLFAESGRLQPSPIVLRLDVPRDELVERLRRRREVQGRGDDADEVIARRLQIYDAETAPVIDILANWADVVPINGAQPVEAVTTEIMEKLGARNHPSRRPAHDDRS